MSSNPSAPKGLLTIAQMAAISGVSQRTLRFYEDLQLLQPHRVGMARFYSHEDRARLEFIMKGKRLGFSLKQIERLIRDADAAPSATLCDVTATLAKDEVRRQIDELTKRRAWVQTAIDELAALPAIREKGELVPIG